MREQEPGDEGTYVDEMGDQSGVEPTFDALHETNQKWQRGKHKRYGPVLNDHTLLPVITEATGVYAHSEEEMG